MAESEGTRKTTRRRSHRNQDGDGGKLHGMKGIAAYLGVSYRTVRRWAKIGFLPTPSEQGPNGRRYWTEEQVEAWIQGRESAQ